MIMRSAGAKKKKKAVEQSLCNVVKTNKVTQAFKDCPTEVD